jgi:tetratricopeptide (TPR) repeat protein
LQGQAHGTPAYMSPEQAAGRLDDLGPATDVYSLGAMLYHLLTGRAPFEGDDVHDVLRRVRLGEFPPPRQVAPTTDPALEAICLKAMAREPADRYDSSATLARDIESWLAEEPVSAWREPALRRLRRWARRHRPIVTGAAGLLVATTVALAVGSALLRDANARIRTEWSRAEDNYRDAVEQRKKAEANQARAETNQARAEANYAMARDAVDRFYTQVSEDKLLNEPHMDELRRELLATAREFYEGLAAGRTDDARSRADLGHAFLQLARIGRALGSMPEAIAQVEKARATFAELVEARPDDTENLRGLANCEEELGTLLASTGQNARADEAYRRALDLRRQLAAKKPDDPEIVNELAAGYNSLGRFYQVNAGDAFFRGRAAESEAMSREALALWERLAEAHPEVPRYRNNLAVVLNNLGRVYMQLRRGDEAEAVHARALELWEGLAAENPEVVDFQDGLALGHNNLGIDYIETGRPGPAEEHYRKALEIWQRLADQHPERIDLAVKLGGNTCNLGNFLNHSGEYERSLEWYDRATATLEGVLRREPRHVMGRDFLRNTNWGRATALFSLRRFDDSLASTERAIELDDGRARDRLRLFRSIVLVNLGDHRRAVSEVEAVSDTPSLPPGYLAIDVARVLARASAAVLEDPELGPTERRDQSDRLASRALEQLERCRTHGFFDVPGELASFDEDGDFDPLRTRPEFLRWRQDLGFPADPFAR